MNGMYPKSQTWSKCSITCIYSECSTRLPYSILISVNGMSHSIETLGTGVYLM